MPQFLHADVRRPQVRDFFLPVVGPRSGSPADRTGSPPAGFRTGIYFRGNFSIFGRNHLMKSSVRVSTFSLTGMRPSYPKNFGRASPCTQKGTVYGEYRVTGKRAQGNAMSCRNFAQPQWRCIDPRRVSARRLKWAGGRRAEGNSVDGETAGEPKMGRGTTRSPQEKKGVATA